MGLVYAAPVLVLLSLMVVVPPKQVCGLMAPCKGLWCYAPEGRQHMMKKKQTIVI